MAFRIKITHIQHSGNGKPNYRGNLWFVAGTFRNLQATNREDAVEEIRRLLAEPQRHPEIGGRRYPPKASNFQEIIDLELPSDL